MLIGEILTDAGKLAGIAGEYAYWQARASGFSEGEIRGTLTLSVALYCCFAVSLASPSPSHSERWQLAALAFVFTPVERLAARIYPQRWFYAVRALVLSLSLAVMGSMLLSAPKLISQDRQRQAGFYDQEIRIRALEITTERVNARLDNIDRRLAESNENDIWMRNGIFTIIGALAILFFKELLGLLLGGWKKQQGG